VLIPFGEGHPYDLAVWLGGPTFARVQCKTAWPVGGCLVFNCRSTDHGPGPQSYVGLADVFGVYFPPRRSVYLVPIDGVANCEGRLRLEPTRNNQRRGIRFASEFEIDRWSLDLLREIAGAAAREEEPLATVA
jgi:PD-(D/E)XK endonuclease